MNLLFTGGTGFVGRFLTTRLAEFHKIYNITSKANLETSHVNHLSIDLSQELGIDDLIRIESQIPQVDAIVHMAFVTCTKININDLSIFHKNIKITENITKIAERLQPPAFINFSSSSVYPNIDGNFDEFSYIQPSKNSDALYGLGKVCAENLIDFRLKNQKTSIIHLRISQVVNDDMPEHRIWPMLKREYEDTGSVTIYGNGQRTINFTRPEDLYVLVRKLLKENQTGILNVNSETLSLNEIAGSIIGAAELDLKRIKYQNHGDNSRFVLNSERYQNLLTRFDEKGV